MRAQRIFVAVLLATSAMMASDYHGSVKSGGLPFPGVTITATRGDPKLVTTTDEQGAFSFSDLPDAPGRSRSRCSAL